ncbi:MAG: hypothetical protein JWL96_789 [Sphingomonas bacterium]|uniref:hypothetical protein n=1 Tax=Sphingomonas bacterium TaxID=1895847 RepID=UPI00262B828C|nr:hypothetical protein [Sphingomonas bacterium]MDB5708719.1 hypothetical protein [Sphingomonas bacterium]
MNAIFLLLAQVVTPAVSLSAAGPPDRSHTPVAHPRCNEIGEEDGDVVVCGHIDHGERYRIQPLTHRYDPVGGPGIGMKVGAGQANVYSTSQKSPDGKPDKRIMVKLKLPF